MPKSQTQRAKRSARRIFASLKSSEKGLVLEGSAEVVEIEAAEGESQRVPEFSMVAYTGAPMRPGGWYAEHPVVIDISGMDVPNGGRIPIHRDHDRTKVVGHSTSVKRGGNVTIKGHISASNDHAREVVASSKNQFPWQSSVGAKLLAQPSFVAEGDSVRVNGRVYKGPIFVARKTRLFEASFVSIGADGNTSAVAASDGGLNVEKKFRKWLEARGFNPDEMDEGQITAMQELFDATTKDEGDGQQVNASESSQSRESEPTSPLQIEGNDDGADAITAHRKMLASETRRAAFIRQHLGEHPELMANAIEQGWSEDRVQLEALRQTGARAPAIHVEAQLRDNPNAIECSMMMASGLMSGDEAVTAYGERSVGVARRQCPQAPGIKYLIHEFLRAHGNYEHISQFSDSTIRAALQLNDRIGMGMVQAHQGFSTISLSGTLSNIAHKSLLRAFNAVPSVFRRFCRTTGHSDFKVHTKFRVTTFGDLAELPPGGEIKHTEMGDEKYENVVKTYARMISLTRTMMRNDDLDAFMSLPAGLGRISAETLERSVFEVLTNNTNNFHSDVPLAVPGQAGKFYSPNALPAGAASALSLISLGEAEVLFWDQTDLDGKPILLQPSVLLVGNKLRRDAMNLVNRTTVTVAGDPASGEQLRVGNEFQGEFAPISSPYVNNGVGGASDTQWWLFAAPSADVAAYEVAFLDNRQTPHLESAETDFSSLGMQWRTYWDWGVAEMERRAMVYSPGA